MKTNNTMTDINKMINRRPQLKWVDKNKQYKCSTTTVDGVDKLSVFIDSNEMMYLMNKHWMSIKDALSRSVVDQAMRGGYRELTADRVAKVVGESELYKGMLNGFIEEFIDTQYPRKALLIGSSKMIRGISQYEISCDVYFEPAVTWKTKVPGVDNDLVVKVPKLPDNIVELMINDELVAAQDKQRILNPAVDTTAKPIDGQVVCVHIHSSINGEKWEEGCATSRRWPVEEKYFKVKELYTTLKDMVPGTTADLTFKLPEVYGDQAGSEVKAKLSLVQCFDKQLPNIDDDLAKSYGFDNLEAWKASLSVAAKAKVEETRRTMVENAISAQLMNEDVVDVGSIPQVWIAEKARDTYESARQTAGSDEALLEQIRSAKAQTISGAPVVDKQTTLLFLAERAAQQLVTDLVFRAWGISAGLGTEDDLSLTNLATYVVDVQNRLKSVAKVEEYDA